ncbi:MAG: phosphoribosylaminoimidazolesuccinocarboxamide synthase [bacterium]
MSPLSTDELVLQTNFPDLKLLGRGKVRDMYDLGEHLLIIATDRISAFDVIMPQGIPHKGRVLTQISMYWFQHTQDIIPNHLVATEVGDFPAACHSHREQLLGRSMLVRKTKPLPIECVVRGYLAGSGWVEYQESGSVCGVRLPDGLLESSRLRQPIFTPATKAEAGQHDENIPFERVVQILGRTHAEQVRDLSIAIYQRASTIAEKRGLLIADTKMEFGLLNGDLLLIDELLTPDSSRFWPEADYKPGGSQPSFDKQYLRDYLLSIKWNKKPPAPDLPAEVIRTTSAKYVEALERLAGVRIED